MTLLRALLNGCRCVILRHERLEFVDTEPGHIFGLDVVLAVRDRGLSLAVYLGRNAVADTVPRTDDQAALGIMPPHHAAIPGIEHGVLVIEEIVIGTVSVGVAVLVGTIEVPVTAGSLTVLSAVVAVGLGPAADAYTDASQTGGRGVRVHIRTPGGTGRADVNYIRGLGQHQGLIG